MKRIAHITCSCKHEFQDTLYKGKRVANVMDKSVKSTSTTVDVKCTVCAKVHSVNTNSLR